MSAPTRFTRFHRAAAFTLIELLTVIAVIAILSGITLGVVRGVGDQAKINRATSELGVLSGGLEAYRRYFGDYPWVGGNYDTHSHQLDPHETSFVPGTYDRAYNLFRALAGRLGPKRLDAANKGVVQRQIDKDGAMADKYTKPFVDVTLFTLERSKTTELPNGDSPLPEPATSPTVDDPDFSNAFLDPWGNRYLYYYKHLANDQNPANAKWKHSGYHLFSAGPDGKVSYSTADITAGNLPDQTAPENADNIYATP